MKDRSQRAAPIGLTEEQREYLLAPKSLPQSISINGKTYSPEKPIDAGFKGAVWRVRDEFGRRRALKLCVYDDYANRSYLQEVSRAARLESYRVFAQFVDAGLLDCRIGPLPRQKYVAFVEEWIDGETLDAFLRETTRRISASFFRAYVASLATGLSALRAVGLRHDDLHARNVMIARPASGEITQEWSIKIIDTGSLKPDNPPTAKPKDDHRHFVDHLVLIWNTIHARRILSVRDRRFLTEAWHLLESMLDDEPGIALREPGQIVRQFDLAYTRASSARSGNHRALADPFEFISAEHIADDRVLVNIFARSCPYLAKVDGPDPCLVTGPRGCGKSTMFRWLSLRAHLHKETAEIEPFRIAGFYVSCSSDLQNKLGWIETAALAKRFRNEIVHYFNLVLARELVQTLSLVAERPDREAAWGFGLAEEESVWRFVLRSLGDQPMPLVQGVSRVVQAVEVLEEELFTTHIRMVRRRNLSSFTSAAFLGDLTALLSKLMPYFQSKRITFLLDDYSSHRIPPPVQIVLNQVIWQRTPSHIFKLSSEKYGAELTDTLGATVEVSREMIEIDCGREYLALDDSARVNRARTFAVELLDRRLADAGYAGNSMALIGRSNWAERSLGRALAMKPPGRVLDQYHGVDCIANICSGDVSTLLLVYRRIFEAAEVTQTSTTLISKTTQHSAIVSVSRELFDAIRHHVPCGPQMHSIVAAFGTFVRRVLQDGRWIRKGESATPAQCPRIELDQPHGGVFEDLTEPQKFLAKELVRRAVFIEMEPGLSRHRNVTTLRWHLRRVYLPSFGASLAKNDALKESVNWLKYLLTNPSEACEMAWEKRSNQPDGSEQRLLFSTPGQDE